MHEVLFLADFMSNNYWCRKDLERQRMEQKIQVFKKFEICFNAQYRTISRQSKVQVALSLFRGLNVAILAARWLNLLF